MRRLTSLHRWLGEHVMLVDACWAGFVTLLCLVVSAGVLSELTVGWVGWLAWTLLGTSLPLVWRRTRPDPAMAAVALGCVFQLVIADNVVPQNLAALMMLYAVAAHGHPRWRYWWLAAALVGGVVGAWDWTYNWVRPAGAQRVEYAVISWVFVAAMSVACFVPGALARQRRDLVQSLRDRADSLERERDSMARLAAQEERARIAREMHDVVAHSLSVIVVQADGASYAVEHGDVDASRMVAARTLATIGDTARGALGETRRLVGVLREEGEAAAYTPQATLEQVEELVAHVNDAGLPATLTQVGDERVHEALGPAQQMAAYRVVQEALTNALKHAGPAATVRVELAHHPDRVELAVRDTGRGPGGGSDGRGHGLIGMRERMASIGGTFTARERVGGGFEVLASLPTRDPEAPTAPTVPVPVTTGRPRERE
ncbi:sensor histidine kinase [Arsenicicoccus cauae]|nr:histidine kinase [Arsenicicoccus cauae]